MSAIEFTTTARGLTVFAKRAGLRAPSFRTPPRRQGNSRTVRRYPDGTFLVSVVIHDRDRQEVIVDMVEGIIVANQLTGGVATAATSTLWRALLQAGVEAA